MSIKNYVKKKLKDKDFKKQYGEYDLYYEVGHLITEARFHRGLTQDKLANLIGTDQSSIARAESGRTLPSLTFLNKIADAVGSYLIAPKFAFMNEKKIPSESIVVDDIITVTAYVDADITASLYSSLSPNKQSVIMKTGITK